MRTIDKLKGVTIGIPTLFRPIPIQWAFSLASLHPPINYYANLALIPGMEVAAARNAIVKSALNSGTEYILMVGDDTEPPGHTLRQLIYRMEHDAMCGMVGGVYCSKSDPPAPLVFRGNGSGSYWDWTVGEYFEVTGMGMDCTLLRVKMFKDIPEPWFKTIRDDGHLDGIAKHEAWTEDLYFCGKVEKTPWKMMIDSMVLCKHWQHMGGSNWRSYELRPDSKPFRRMKSPDGIAGSKRILDVGCGPVHFDFGAEGEVTRFDARDDCDPDYRGDARQLPFADGQFDVVFSSHTLEHFGRDEVEDVLREWVRVLKPGGELRIIVPNLEWAAKRILESGPDWDSLNVLYGSQEYALNFHRAGFTPATLDELMRKVGVEPFKVETIHYNIIMRGSKPNPLELAKINATMPLEVTLCPA